MKEKKIFTFLILTFLWSWTNWSIGLNYLSDGINQESIGKFITYFFIGVYGPSISGVLTTLFFEGPSGLLDLLKKLIIWKTPFKNYLFIILLPIVFVIIGIVLYSSVTINGKSYDTWAHKMDWPHFDFDAIYRPNETILVTKGGGVLYRFKDNSFERLDKSFEHRNKYRSYDFTFENKIFSYGGYGLFMTNSNLTFFNELNQEWSEFFSIQTQKYLLRDNACSGNWRIFFCMLPEGPTNGLMRNLS